MEYLEENESLKQEKLISLDSLTEIILERNLEALPFFQYVKTKFNAPYQSYSRKNALRSRILPVKPFNTVDKSISPPEISAAGSNGLRSHLF